MKFMEKLLVGEKVEWKKLGEVCEILDNKRKPIAKKDRIIGTYPYYGANGIQSFVNNYIFDGSFILMGEDGSVINKDKSPVLHWITNKKIWVNNHAHVLGQLNIRYNLKYIYHYLSIVDVSSIVKGTPPKINQANMKEIKIPIPSLEIQEKIVKILDNFTKCVTELQAELQARNKQYNYYRDMLLSEDYLNKISEKYTENQFIEWKMLGELFEFKNGLNKGKNFFGKGMPIINYMDVYKRNKIYSDDLLGSVETTEDEQKRYSIKRGDVFFTRTSETKEEIGKTSVLLDDVEKGVFSGFVLRARPITELLLPEYCAYCFETYEFRKNVIRYSTYTTRALTNGTTLSNLKIPVPSIEIQNKIVKILDRFQELLSDTKGLLPLEIEQRRKQYEYYREKLLTFDKEEGYALSTAQHSTATNNE